MTKADARRSWISEPHPTDAATGVCPECYSKGFADAEATAERRVTQLEEALRRINDLDMSGTVMYAVDIAAAALSAGEGAAAGAPEA